MKGHEIFNLHLETLRKYLVNNSINQEALHEIEQSLNSIPFFSAFYYKTNVAQIKRVTINKRVLQENDCRIEEIKFLKYPPSNYVTKFGRANLQQESILYGTFDHLTALSEMRPEIGDRITISTWQLSTEYDLTLCPIFKISTLDGVVHNEMSLRSRIQYNKLLKRYDDETAKQIDMLHQFIADCFAKRAHPENHFDYFMSAYFANKILHMYEEGAVDALFYPSVRQSLTMTNIAIKPTVFDANYNLVLVEEFIIQETPVYNGGWFLDGIQRSNNFENGRIVWNN